MPTSLGRYDVRAKIADGGMATIYLGREKNAPPLEGAVALKVIKDEYALNLDFVHMFVDEAKITSRLNHPNIVKIRDFSASEDRLFLAMDFLLGQSLWSVWDACKERKVRLRYDMIAWICARVCEALHYAHELKDENGVPLEMVHRDVNATNIFIEYDGKVKVIDFGLAKAVGRVSRTAAGVIKGKLAYMSPEQVTGGGLDRRADIFALGVTLWEMSVDRRLFKVKDDIETLKAVHEARVPDPTQLVHGYPPLLWKVLKRALVRDRDARYATAKDMAAALDAFIASEGSVVGPSDVADAMKSLFEHERERQMAWVMEATDPGRSAPSVTLNPPPDQADYSEMGSKVAPAPGTFEAATAQSQKNSTVPKDVEARLDPEELRPNDRNLKSPKIPAAPGVPIFDAQHQSKPNKQPQIEKVTHLADGSEIAKKKPELAITDRKSDKKKKMSDLVKDENDEGVSVMAMVLGVLVALLCVGAVAMLVMKK
ncbi:MAG: serine/threonine-protein kinase [Polyangiaceae bacterium]